MKQVVSIILTLCYTCTFVVQARVDSLSLEQFKDQNGERYWEVTAKCAKNNVEKTMKRIVGRGNPWCSIDNSKFCNKNKFTLSRALCSSANLSKNDVVQQSVTDTQATTQPNSKESGSSTASLGGADSKTSAAETSIVKTTPSQIVTPKSDRVDRSSKKNELLREQVQIEEQRIQIEQRRLQLVQIELDLKKQLLNQ